MGGVTMGFLGYTAVRYTTNLCLLCLDGLSGNIFIVHAATMLHLCE